MRRLFLHALFGKSSSYLTAGLLRSISGSGHLLPPAPSVSAGQNAAVWSAWPQSGLVVLADTPAFSGFAGALSDLQDWSAPGPLAVLGAGLLRARAL